MARVRRPPQLYFTQYRPARKSWEEEMEPKCYERVDSIYIYIYIYIYLENLRE